MNTPSFLLPLAAMLRPDSDHPVGAAVLLHTDDDWHCLFVCLGDPPAEHAPELVSAEGFRLRQARIPGLAVYGSPREYADARIRRDLEPA